MVIHAGHKGGEGKQQQQLNFFYVRQSVSVVVTAGWLAGFFVLIHSNKFE